MQPLEIDSAVFCDGAHYTIISRENSSILTCPVASGAGGYTLNRVEVRDIDREAGRLTGHAACIAVDVPTWCRIAGDPLDAVADALADLLDETPSRFELEQLAAASPLLKANTPGIPVFPGGIAPAANSYTLAGCCRAALVRHAVAQHGRPLPRGAPRRRVARALPLAHRPVHAGPRRQEGSWFEQTGRDGRRAQARALGTALPVREHAFTRPRPDHIIRAISTSPPLFRGGSL